MLSVEERIAQVLVEHFFHFIEFTGAPEGRWAIECNCDEIVFAVSHEEVEQVFASHQAAAVSAAMEPARG